jgi:Transposase DDE domain
MRTVGLRNTYVDYLLSTEGHISATDLSVAVEGKYSHDQLTRLLASGAVNDKTIYLKGKHYIKQKGIKGTVTLSIDDSLVPKPHMQFSNIVNWHYDDAKRRCVKGINFISALWSDDQASVPLSLQVVEKELRWNENKQQYRWKCIRNKNELMRSMVQRLTRSKQVGYVLADSWYSSKKNMNYLVEECGTDFILSVRCNRAVARSEKEAQKGNFRPLRELKLGKGAVKLYLKGVHFPVLVVKQVYKNADGSSSTLYLATSDLELSAEQIVQLYKRRWKVEEYHKSMKSNCSLGKCQAPSLTAQQSHFYLAALAFLLLEKTKVKEDHNHFALKKQLNLLTIKYGMKVIKQFFHSKAKFVYNAA